jgi:hypothetical protein
MTQVSDRWLVSLAEAACAASRWCMVASIVATTLGLAVVVLDALNASWLQRGAATVAVACFAAQTYLAVRMELDRKIFRVLGTRPAELDEELAALDEALARLLGRKNGPRSLDDRACGVVRLLRLSGALLAVQVCALTGALWSRV